MSGFTYIPKSSKIYVVTLPATQAWTAVLTEAQAKAVRGIKMKPRFVYTSAQPSPFDYAFKSAPDETGTVSDGNGFVSNSGSGWSDTIAPTSGIWARSGISGTAIILEVQVYE